MLPEQVSRTFRDLVPAATLHVLSRWPGAERLGDAGRLRCEEDVAYHLENLASAVVLQTPSLFAAYASWAGQVLAARGLPPSCMEVALEAVALVIEGASLPEDVRERARQALAAAGAGAVAAAASDPCLVDRDAFHASVQGDRRTLLDRVARWHAEGGAAHALRQLALLQHDVGEAWLSNQITVAQEHRATALTQLALSTLAPFTAGAPGPRPRGRAVIACAPGDWHAVGPRIAADLLELAGYEVEFLGANTPVQQLVGACLEVRPTLVGVGVAPIASLPAAREAAAAVRAALPGIRVLVGGRAARVAGAEALGADVLAGPDFDGSLSS